MLPSVGGFAISFGSYFEILIFDLMNYGIRLEIYMAKIIRMDRVHIRLLKKCVFKVACYIKEYSLDTYPIIIYISTPFI